MWYSKKTKRKVLEAIYKLYAKHGRKNVTLEKARKAAKKIDPNFPMTKPRFDGYRGAHVSRFKHKKFERRK